MVTTMDLDMEKTRMANVVVLALDKKDVVCLIRGGFYVKDPTARYEIGDATEDRAEMTLWI